MTAPTTETPAPTRADLARAVILWEAIAAEAKAQAAANRAVLDEQARTELETNGSAPTWRIPDVGTVPLALTSPAVVVEDEAAYVAWMAERYPTEVHTVQQVRPAFDAQLRTDLAAQGGDPCDLETGEVIPGLRYVPGGRPRGVSVRASAKARDAVRTQARYLLGLPDPDGS